MIRQKFRPFFIILLSSLVAVPIEFNNKSRFYTEEICNEGSYGNLSTKFCSSELTFLDLQPKAFFG